MRRIVYLGCSLAIILVVGLLAVAGGGKGGVQAGDATVSPGKEAKELEVVIGTADGHVGLHEMDRRAVVHRKAGEYEAAIGLYREMIAGYEALGDRLGGDVLNSLKIHYMRKIAACYKDKGDLDAAIGEYWKVTALAEANAFQEEVDSSLLAMAEAMLESGRYEGRIEEILSKRRWQNAWSLLRLAKLYLGHGNNDQAIAELQKLLQDYSDSFYYVRDANHYVREARYQLGNCYVIKAQRAGGGGCCTKKAKLSKEAIDNYEAALAEFSGVLDYMTQDIERLYHISNSILRCHIKLGRGEELNKFLSDYYEEFPSSCRRVIGQRPNTDKAAIAQYYMGKLYIDKKQYEKAKEEFEKVLNIEAANAKDIKARAHFSIAWILKLQGHYQKAIREYQSGRGLNPEGSYAVQALFDIAEAYYAVGDEANTKKALEETINTYPGSRAARRASLMLEGLSLIKPRKEGTGL